MCPLNLSHWQLTWASDHVVEPISESWRSTSSSILWPTKCQSCRLVLCRSPFGSNESQVVNDPYLPSSVAKWINCPVTYMYNIFRCIYIYTVYTYIYIYVCMHIYIYVVNLIMGCPIDMNQPCQVRFIAEGKSSHCWVAPIYEELRCSNSC